MEKFINKLQTTPSSGADILNYLDGKTNIISYPEIYRYKSLDELLYPGDSCVILYEYKDHFGHWCCIFKAPYSPNTVEFFDPYGKIIDTEFKFVPEDFQKKHYPDNKYLSKLVYGSGYNLEFNDYPIQNEKNKDIATCGAHCAIRLENKSIPIDNYYKIIKSFPPYTPDEIVAALFFNK